jgi:probable F420-dependent oxidoreductase
MKPGVVFPQTEIGTDPGFIRDYAVAIEEVSFDHLVLYDHVTGSPPERFDVSRLPFSEPAYTDSSAFHEPFVLFGFLAAATRRLELVTGVLVAPQRQTVLIAKQAAAADVLSGGRVRLGIGLGWNYTEYEALNEDFYTRGRRISEQIEVMRRLWSEPLVTYTGRWHQLDRVGINPLPVQHPIPIWLGGTAEAVLRRIADYADGWFPQFTPSEEGRATVERLNRYIIKSGRTPSDVGMEARMSLRGANENRWVDRACEWRDFGATHLSVSTMKTGLTTPNQHLEAVCRFKQAVAAAGM